MEEVKETTPMAVYSKQVVEIHIHLRDRWVSEDRLFSVLSSSSLVASLNSIVLGPFQS